MENQKFVYVTHINTTPEKLWEALTKPEFTQQYWGGLRIQSDWTTGASVKIIRPDGRVELKGEVLQAERPRVLSYTFQSHDKEGSPVEAPSRVTFEISEVYGVTTLTVTHDGFEPNSRIFAQIRVGWQAILSSMKTLLETGKALPFTFKY